MIDSPLKHTIRTKRRRDLLAERLSNRYEWQATLEPCLDSYNLNLREYLSDFKFQIFLASSYENK